MAASSVPVPQSRLKVQPSTLPQTGTELPSTTLTLSDSRILTIAAGGTLELPSTLSPEDALKIIQTLADQNKQLAKRLQGDEQKLQQELIESKSNLKRMYRENSHLRTEMNRLSDQFDKEKRELHASIGSLNAKIQRLQEDAGILTPSERAFLEADIRHLQSQKERMEEELSKAEAKIFPLRTEVGELEFTIRTKDDKIQEQAKKIFQLEASLREIIQLTQRLRSSSPYL